MRFGSQYADGLFQTEEMKNTKHKLALGTIQWYRFMKIFAFLCLRSLVISRYQIGLSLITSCKKYKLQRTQETKLTPRHKSVLCFQTLLESGWKYYKMGAQCELRHNKQKHPMTSHLKYNRVVNSCTNSCLVSPNSWIVMIVNHNGI